MRPHSFSSLSVWQGFKTCLISVQTYADVQRRDWFLGFLRTDLTETLAVIEAASPAVIMVIHHGNNGWSNNEIGSIVAAQN